MATINDNFRLDRLGYCTNPIYATRITTSFVTPTPNLVSPSANAGVFLGGDIIGCSVDIFGTCEATIWLYTKRAMWVKAKDLIEFGVVDSLTQRIAVAGYDRIYVQVTSLPVGIVNIDIGICRDVGEA